MGANIPSGPGEDKAEDSANVGDIDNMCAPPPPMAGELFLHRTESL